MICVIHNRINICVLCAKSCQVTHENAVYLCWLQRNGELPAEWRWYIFCEQ